MECNTCQKTFIKQSKLDRHMVTHSETRQFKCYLCGQDFKRRDHLNRHLQQHSTEPRPFLCPYSDCFNEGFSSKYHLQRHIKAVHKNPKVCCNTSFIKRSSYFKHVIANHPECVNEMMVSENQKLFKCDQCEQIFFKQQKKDSHMKKCQIILGKRKDCDFECFDLGDWNYDLFVEKMLFKEEIKEEVQVIEVPLIEQIVHKQTTKSIEKFAYKCYYDNCGKIYSRPSNLKTHIKTYHLQVKEYQCEHCQSAYKHKKSLKEHLDKGCVIVQ